MTNDRIVVHFDGSYDPRTNVASYGVIIRRGASRPMWRSCRSYCRSRNQISRTYSSARREGCRQ